MIIGSIAFSVALLVAIVVPQAATAGLLTSYDSRSDFQADLVGFETLTFDWMAEQQFARGMGIHFRAGDVIIRGRNYNRPGYLYVVDDDFSANYDYNSGNILLGGNSRYGGDLQIFLPGVLAVGADLMQYGLTYGGVKLQYVLSDGTRGTLATASHRRPDRAFLGLVSDTPIVALRAYATESNILMDNLTLGIPRPADPDPVSAVPEPSTLISGLLGIGLAGVLGLSGRFTKQESRRSQPK